MKRNVVFALVLAVALVIVAAVFSLRPALEKGAREDVHVVAGGHLKFVRPADFGLAVTQEQLLVRSYIPPCDFEFDYCLYYNAPTYEGTTFESAGLRIQNRHDLATESACLNTQPAGYINLQPDVRRGEGYATATFAPLQDAAVGHYASGELYRLYFEGACYEFETRLGQSQFANYPPGTIKEFTEEDAEAVRERLRELLAHVRFPERPEEAIFPPTTPRPKI